MATQMEICLEILVPAGAYQENHSLASEAMDACLCHYSATIRSNYIIIKNTLETVNVTLL